MTISYADIDSSTRCINLSGRLDFQEVEKILEQFTSMLSSTAGQCIIVDLTTTSLICSMGIRVLIQNSKIMQERGGCMGLVVNNDTIVAKTLRAVGIDTIVPIFDTVADAQMGMLN